MPKINIPVKIISQRNYHTVALTTDGRIFIAGTFDAFDDCSKNIEVYKGFIPNSKIIDLK